MILRHLAVVASLLLAVGVGAAAEHESIDAHTKQPPKVFVLDNDHIQPSRLEIAPVDALVFENHSPHPMIVRFTEPDDVVDRIRCGLIRKSDKEKSQVPWQLFTWNGGHLVATIPPGRFASVCSFAPGDYAFLVTRITQAPNTPGASGKLPEKGLIAVK